VIKEWILRLYTFMGRKGETLLLYKQVHHQTTTLLPEYKTLEHVSATVSSHLRGYLKTQTSLSIALPADGYG
jgi:hypothetical protein